MAFQIGSNFQLDAQLPLDVRTVVSTQSERNNLVTSNKAYSGLLVYVTTENKYYYYNGSSWLELTISGGTSGNANLDFLIINSSFIATPNTKIAANTTTASFVLTLPDDPQDGDIVEVLDIQNTFHINNLTINPNGYDLENQPETLVCNIKGAHFVLIFYAGVWSISILDNNNKKVGYVDTVESYIPMLSLDIQSNSELFDSLDSTNYKIPWNNVQWYNTQFVAFSSVVDTTKFITYNSVNKNIYIREPGIYNIDLRFGSFNMVDATDFLRARLRSSSSPIEGGLSTNPPNPPAQGLAQPDGGGANVFAAFAQGPIGTSQNGEAMCAGFTTFRIDTPTYLVADFLHFGAFNTVTSLARGFPVFNNTFGNRPFLFLSKIV